MIEIGQKLFYVPHRQHYAASREPRGFPVVVTKIGRRWLTTQTEGRYPFTYRIDKNTLAAHSEGFQSPGRCYLSQQEYERLVVTNEMWQALKNRLPWVVPDSVTIEDIEAIAAKFGITMPEGMRPR